MRWSRLARSAVEGPCAITRSCHRSASATAAERSHMRNALKAISSDGARSYASPNSRAAVVNSLRPAASPASR